MQKLERLTQDDEGNFFAKGRLTNSDMPIPSRDLTPKGRIRVLILENPVDIEEEIKKYANNYPSSVPKDANAYIISDFNGGTQHARKDEKEKEHMCSAYALQFYKHPLLNNDW
ncbi:MAG: hypothetical protein AABW50_03360 [Nanoarchaeota archaeon]